MLATVPGPVGLDPLRGDRRRVYPATITAAVALRTYYLLVTTVLHRPFLLQL